jgi:hypothetical protein
MITLKKVRGERNHKSPEIIFSFQTFYSIGKTYYEKVDPSLLSHQLTLCEKYDFRSRLPNPYLTTLEPPSASTPTPLRPLLETDWVFLQQ